MNRVEAGSSSPHHPCRLEHRTQADNTDALRSHSPSPYYVPSPGLGAGRCGPQTRTGVLVGPDWKPGVQCRGLGISPKVWPQRLPWGSPSARSPMLLCQSFDLSSQMTLLQSSSEAQAGGAETRGFQVRVTEHPLSTCTLISAPTWRIPDEILRAQSHEAGASDALGTEAASLGRMPRVTSSD